MSNIAEGWFLDGDEPSEIIEDLSSGLRVYVDREQAEKELEKDPELWDLYKITIERIIPKERG